MAKMQDTMYNNKSYVPLHRKIKDERLRLFLDKFRKIVQIVFKWRTKKRFLIIIGQKEIEDV